ncbi:MAG: M28 family peptidase [Chloroflexi bacterium]|nr:M28 family peptidase [Chloroflexota bacterium]
MSPVTEPELISQISRTKLWDTNSRIAQWVRLSGSPAEREAVQYLRGVLDGYGLTTSIIDHPALVSYPLESSLDVLGSAACRYRCLGHAYTASTEGLEAEVVDLGNGTPADYAANDVRGKIVLVNGLAGPVPVYDAERAGAAGEIFVNDDHLHNMVVSTIWGTPTPESAVRIPKHPAVSIVALDGADLRRRLAAGPVRVRMLSRVFMQWQTTPILVGEISGTFSDEFVMFSGHQDSWHEGAMDNGSANATMLEVARLLSLHRQQLVRGLRVIFWSGHSHARYSGSTWYADHHWEELRDHCVAHVNVDSTGARGATYYGSFGVNKELGPLGAAIVQQHTGQAPEAKRMSRAGDMSFNGIGIPSLFMTLSQVPVTSANEDGVSASFSAMIGGKMPWWWHTDGDTIDKVDLDVLELDTRIYVSTLWQLCTQSLLPMDFRPVAADIVTELKAVQAAAGAHLDLTATLARAEQLTRAVERWHQRLVNAAPADVPALNRQMMALSRILIPITYTQAGPFDHDPAWAIPHLPGIQDARKLAGLASDLSAYRFLQTRLTRSNNALMFALREALALLAA